MISLEFAISNILSPAILFFLLGIVAVLVKSDLEVPGLVGSAITLFILLSIGLKGGIAVNEIGVKQVIIPVLSAIFVGMLVATIVYFVMLKMGYDSANAGSIAGHFGACSSVTLTTVMIFLEQIGARFEEFVPALYPFMDTAALITAIILGNAGLKRNSIDGGFSFSNVLRTSMTAKTTVLILGGFMIGLVAGTEKMESLILVYDGILKVAFTIFMLDIGLLVGSRLSDLKTVKPVTFLLAVLLPLLQAVIAILLATLIGLSPGGATIFAVLAAGASYITAPAVMRSTFPEANPTVALGMTLGIIFPFNILVGIPLYYHIANIISLRI